jgi:hypothetical protein
MKMIKIIKCSEPNLWYRNKIGKTLNLLQEDDKYYWARQDGTLPHGGFINIIYKSDACVIENNSEPENNIVLGYD